VASWNGKPGIGDLTVSSPEGADISGVAMSNFSSGVVTFMVPVIFRTSPGWDLFVTGPLNFHRELAQPISGVVETSWLPYPFTMNYRFTEPGEQTFFKGEPLCQVFPVPHGVLAEVEPVWEMPDEGFWEDFTSFTRDRQAFRARMAAGEPEALKHPWQRYYFQGLKAPGQPGPADHINKLRLKEFK
jgi:hypothetical protein